MPPPMAAEAGCAIAAAEPGCPIGAAVEPVGQLPQQLPRQGLGFGGPDTILSQLAGPGDEFLVVHGLLPFLRR